MTSINDPGPRELLEAPNYAVISTINQNGLIHNTIVWISAEDASVAVNSALGRLWPKNLQRDPRVTVLVYEAGDPYHYVEIRGTAVGTEAGADEHINALSKKYIGQDEYPYRRPGERRIKFVIQPEHVRYLKQQR
jgi:PPOX class probable F420-dependent enzyme